MKSVWKWVAIAAVGACVLASLGRINAVTAADDAPAYDRASTGSDRLDRIAEKLDRLLERMEGRMGPGGPPPGDRRGGPHDGPHPEGFAPGRPEWGGPWSQMPRDMRPEGREMLESRMREGRERMEKARDEMKARMEKAREKFQQLEERVRALEAEVERLKAGK